MDDGRKMITKAHPEHSSGELKKKKSTNNSLKYFFLICSRKQGLTFDSRNVKSYFQKKKKKIKSLSVEFVLSMVKVKLEIISYSDINLEQGLYKPINANHC